MSTVNSVCDTITIFSNGGPQDAGASVLVNNVQLVPSPFVTLSVEKYRVGDTVIGGVLKLTLNGNIVGGSFNEVVAGSTPDNYTNINKLLKLSQTKGCVPVEIKCADVLINGTGRISTCSINEGNQPTWVQIAPYTIEIEIYENNTDFNISDPRIVIPDINDIIGLGSDDYALKNLSENLSWSVNENAFDWGVPCSGSSPFGGVDGFGNRHIKLNFSISATGLDACAGTSPGSGLYGLQAAEQYISTRLTGLEQKAGYSLFDISKYNLPPPEIEDVFNTYFIGGKSFLDFRTINVDPLENKIDISGEIIYRPSGCLNPEVFTSLTVANRLTTSDETITISGNITGLTNHSYNEIIKLNNDDFNNCSFNTKINNAEAFLTKINDPDQLSQLANCYAKKPPFDQGYIEDNCEYSSGGDDVCDITPTPISPTQPPYICDMRIVSSDISRNFAAGEISFSFVLSNAPKCDIIGTNKVDVSITHNKPRDNIVEIIIPGRGSKGPLIQNLCCNSAEKYDINIDATLNKKTCNFDIKKQTIDQLRACAEKKLKELVVEDGIDVNCWFKVVDTKTIGNTSYKLSRSYVKPSCP